MRLGFRLALFLSRSRIRPGRTAVIRIGGCPTIERGLQNTIQNVGDPTRALRKPLARTIGRTAAIKLPFERPVTPFLPRALLFVTGLPQPIGMAVGIGAHGILPEPPQPFER